MLSRPTLRSFAQGAAFTVCSTAMALLAAVTFLAMVVAPVCSGIVQQAGLYRIASVLLFGALFVMFALVRRSLVAAVLIPIAQGVAGLSFAEYLNSIPVTCAN